VPFKHFSAILALVILLTACVSDTQSSSTVPITAPPTAEVIGEQPAIEDDVAVRKLTMILCVNRKTFKKAIQRERLRFYGVIPTAEEIIVEIYTAKLGGSGFTIAIRDATQDEVCIMLAGSDLVSVSWSTAE
jgi:ABC-type Fe3+-hydroxamate transport system substrate-binding protein